MRKVTISIQVDAEKLRAIQFYVRKKDSTLESELEDCITKIYEKYVPAQTREYIECISAPERPPRPSRAAPRTEEADGER